MHYASLSQSLETYLVIGAALFGLGLFGMAMRRTFIGMLIASELILCGAFGQLYGLWPVLRARHGNRADRRPCLSWPSQRRKRSLCFPSSLRCIGCTDLLKRTLRQTSKVKGNSIWILLNPSDPWPPYLQR